MKKMMLAALSILLIFNACDDGWGIFDGAKRVKGTGEIEKFTRDVSGFKGISNGISADVFVKQAEAYKVVIEGQKNIVDLIETEIDDEVLTLRFKDGAWNVQFKKLVVYIETPSVSSLSVSGAGDLQTENKLTTTDDFKVRVSGSGNIKIGEGLTAKTLDIEIGGSGNANIGASTLTSVLAEIAGSGNLSIEGTTENAEYRVSGSGEIEAKSLTAKNVEARASGSGNITCSASDSLDAQSSGSSDIVYSGTPPVLRTKANGSGTIRKAN
jgi:hypothetical protein